MKVNKELLKGSTVAIILAMLDQQPMYGYQMIKEIEKHSEGVFVFKEGTLYPILHSLESEGMVESYWTETEGNRRRKYYKITGEGRSQLKEKRNEWAAFYKAVNQVLGEGIV
ncbi:PadR family transcriptional regulator [Pelotomaculum isophthalicicum JI]|uniref:PadR family transcriptional regulator n=1 Tax=Pelotomaculum isophthalicicum JI TaxID=947010 RepID=A0A9X4H5T5_9FIRM|nr:PadR family transcriptional regulator [Pelotomaculum isophthalicicum]MDF9408378.1 PadR family transcriptional regulator [Pelotomaculum isophthalicicum JI]